jgi:heme exporter protein D
MIKTNGFRVLAMVMTTLWMVTIIPVTVVQAKEELRQDRLQKKESEKLLKIQQKQEVRLEKRGKRLQKWETWKQQFLERFQKREDIVDEEVSDETLPDTAAGDETLSEEAVVDEALRKETVVDEALPKETAGNEALPAESGEEDPDDPHI